MKKSDPFEVEPLPKAFYHPSKEKELSKKERKVCLSAPFTSKDTQHQVSSPEDLKFLKETNTLRTAQEIPTRENGSTADLSSTSQFNESWPSTERTGSLGTPLSDGTVSSPEMSQQMREWLEGQDKPVGNSTLGWYINRFRNAPPTDRQKRDHASFISKKKPNFWWLSPPSGPSTPSGQSTPVPGHTPPQKLPSSPMKPTSPTTMKKGRYTSAMSSPSSVHVDDGTTAELDRRAKELLEKSETSVETTSTEPFPLPLKKPAEYKPAQHTAKLSGYKTSPQKTKKPTAEKPELISHQNPWPEDDILYQWRLARKMEKAQEKVSGSGVRVHIKKTDPYNIRRPVDVTHRASSQPFGITLPGLNTLDDVLPGPSGVSTFPGQPTPEVTPQVLSSMCTAVQTPSVTTTSSSNIDNTICGSHAPVSMVTSYGTSTRPIVTPVISQPCQHLESNVDGREANIYHDKLWPHMHLACDILPCQCTGDHDAKMYHHLHLHHKQHEKHKVHEDVNDHVKHQNDEEKENDIPQKEIPQCKKSHFKPALSKKTTESNREENQQNKIKTSSSFEYLSSSTETESERETRITRRKGKLKEVDNKEKRKEKKTFEMVQNVIGKVISEHMFSGSSSTSDKKTSEEKRTTGLEASGTNKKSTSDNEEKRTTGLEASGSNKKSKHPTFTLDQADSSEEEFPDDEILKILRQRSKDLKEELRRIDNLLKKES